MKEAFLKNASLYYKYQKENNIRLANNYAKKLYNIKNNLIKSQVYEEFLDDMMFCENDMARMWAYGICIDFNYREKEAIELLKDLSKIQDEIISRSAKMSLRVRCNIPIK